MKQIEVTTNVKQSLEEVHDILSKQGFECIRKSRVEDRYMSPENEELTKDNIISVLMHCVLIRYLCVDGKETYKNITYKKKDYSGDTVLSEEKIVLKIEDLEKAEKLLKALKFEKIVDVRYDVIVYKRGNVELAFQLVEDLGLLVEYESTRDFQDVSKEEILAEKQKMLQELKSYQLEVSDDYDVKKAYQLILNRM
ncbi:MAG: hypothetical protein IKF71_04605 [Bacilli bacterium]|nr:hypothetical protein [Bacilli bacterium]